MLGIRYDGDLLEEFSMLTADEVVDGGSGWDIIC